MRKSRFTFRKSGSRVIMLGGFLYSLLDDEPAMDFTDWNILHIGLVAVTVAALYSEFSQRAQAGQLVSKDYSILRSALSFTITLSQYARMLVLTLAGHSLLSLETDTFELSETFSAFANWFVADMLVPFFFFGIIMIALHILRLALRERHRSMQLFLCFSITLLLLNIAVLIAWDLAGAGLSAFTNHSMGSTYYGTSKTPLTHERNSYSNYSGGEAYEWHRERTWPFVSRQEDLYFFILNLTLLFDISRCILTWAHLTAQIASRPVSYSYIAYVTAELENLFVALASLFVLGVLLGLRLFNRTAWEGWGG